jgi:hypothetical protein
MRLSELARSKAAELRPARPAERRAPQRAQTMTAPRELRAPRSSAHPIRPRPARPMRGPQSVAAPLPRQADPNRPKRAPRVQRPAAVLRASVDPTPEPAGSTMTAEVRSGPAAHPTRVRGRRVHPRTGRQPAAHRQEA